MKDIMINRYRNIAVPACLALMFSMPLTVNAQAADNQPPTAEGDSGSPNIDGETKQQFVAAYVEIREVQQEYTEKLQNAEDKSKAQQLQKQAQAEMIEIVKDNGLTVEEYNQLVGSMRNNPELRKEIEQRAQAQ